MRLGFCLGLAWLRQSVGMCFFGVAGLGLFWFGGDITEIETQTWTQIDIYGNSE